MYPSFDSILDTLDAGKLYSFPGGVHPEDKKALSNTSPIKKPALPSQLVIPLRQHIGSDGICCVAVGDKVLKGQILSQSSTPFSVPVHAPTSGEIVAIAPHVVAHPSGLSEMCIMLEPDGKDTWCELKPIANYGEADKHALIEAICQAGISGMGGAGFPTHIKTATSKPVEFLILNGIECEPYITSDDRLMREHAWQIRQGLDILTHLINPKAVIVAVEDNKPEAFEALNIACQDKKAYRVVSVETKYPAGGEKQLIQVLTGREVPRNGLPADIGMMMFNVGTCYAIADAILHGKPLIERVVTVTGEAVAAPGNFKALLGTPVSHLLEQAGYNADKQKSPKVIMGGPMMGFTLSDATIPVVKTTNCLLVPGNKELVDDNAERPCIRCSACADVCPASLLPQQMFWHAKAKEYDKAEEYDLFDCIECGACAYVCPSEIPLVHYYRQAKSEIRLQRDEKNKAEKAKQRFEARTARLEREKQEREEKHRKAKEARLAANKAKLSETSGQETQPLSASTGDAKDKVAAALARAKAKKAALQTMSEGNAKSSAPHASHSESPEDDKKAKVAAAIARAKAKKAAQSGQQTQSDMQVQATEQPAPTEDAMQPAPDQDSKQARIAAAVAKAKAKKAEKQNDVDDNNSTQSAVVEPSSTDKSDEKKARIAAAVAKAKAKKVEPATSTTKEDAPDETRPLTQPDSDEKKARIAAAVAKAKAKKAATQQPSKDDDIADNSQATLHSEGDEKKARIAAAVAKAKARKEAKEALASELSEDNTASTSEVDEKKARIAAAVAKAKAKKDLKDALDNSQTTVKDDSELDKDTTVSHSELDEKKARIAAAIAKAKAKKAAAEKENGSQ
ncbi:electron transport complex subunit RsxC [Alteromonas sp. D210916BOD_24]|uniref:electron transport complex subunit RsxC n=1 Tax=Alteromonas sp. D210916BOD_24 TaxID=3157618 RepID=UPI00399C6C4A